MGTSDPQQIYWRCRYLRDLLTRFAIYIVIYLDVFICLFLFLFNVIALYVVDFLSTGSICKYVYSTLVIAYLLYCNFYLYSLINNKKEGAGTASSLANDSSKELCKRIVIKQGANNKLKLKLQSNLDIWCSRDLTLFDGVLIIKKMG